MRSFRLLGRLASQQDSPFLAGAGLRARPARPSRVLAGRARVLAVLKRHAEASADVGRAVASVDGDARPWLAGQLEDRALDPLRSRAGYRTLLLDLRLPGDPFAR